MPKFFKFKLNRVLSRKEKRPVFTGAWRHNKQQCIRYCKGVHNHGVTLHIKYKCGTGVVARQRYLNPLEDC